MTVRDLLHVLDRRDIIRIMTGDIAAYTGYRAIAEEPGSVAARFLPETVKRFQTIAEPKTTANNIYVPTGRVTLYYTIYI